MPLPTPLAAVYRNQLNDLGDGTFTVSVEGGVLSCNPPDGHFTVMPKGTAGPYEQCRIAGASLVFAPDWGGPRVAYLIPFADVTL